MPDSTTDAAERLRKLGMRLRRGVAIKRPIAETSLATVRQAVRDEWRREHIAKQKQAVKPIAPKSPTRKPQEPDQNR